MKLHIMVLLWVLGTAFAGVSGGAEPSVGPTIILDDFEDEAVFWETVVHPDEGPLPVQKPTTNAFIGQQAMAVHVPGRPTGSAELIFNLDGGYPLTEKGVDGLAFYIKARDAVSARQTFWVRFPENDWVKRWTIDGVAIGDTNWHKIVLKSESLKWKEHGLSPEDAKRVTEMELIFEGKSDADFFIDCLHGWNEQQTDEDVRKAVEKLKKGQDILDALGRSGK